MLSREKTARKKSSAAVFMTADDAWSYSSTFEVIPNTGLNSSNAEEVVK